MSDQKKFNIGDVVITEGDIERAVRDNTGIYARSSPVEGVLERADGFDVSTANTSWTSQNCFILAKDAKKHAMKYAIKKLEFVANHPEYEVKT